MKIFIAYDEKKCKSMFGISTHKWVEKHFKNHVTYSECSKCGARKAVGPDNAVFSFRWLDSKTDLVKKSPEKKVINA